MSNRSDPTRWMWAQACDLMEQADRLHRQFFQLRASEDTLATWEPPVDVFEDEHEIVIIAAMPGVTAERVQVIREPDGLVVRGTRPLPLSGSHHRIRQLEIPYGAFERRIPLPLGRLEVGAPQLIQGCLVLSVRKTGASR